MLSTASEIFLTCIDNVVAIWRNTDGFWQPGGVAHLSFRQGGEVRFLEVHRCATERFDVLFANARPTLFDGVDSVRQTLDLIPGLLCLGVFATFLETLFKTITFLLPSREFGCQF